MRKPLAFGMTNNKPTCCESNYTDKAIHNDGMLGIALSGIRNSRFGN